MITTMTISEFLLARIAEDEAVAQRAASHGADFIGYDTGDRRPDWRAEAGPYDPSRVLAECAAKRRIVGLHQCVDDRRLYGAHIPRYCIPCQDVDGYGGEAIGDRGSWPCETLKALAAPYADHPDYDGTWRL